MGSFPANYYPQVMFFGRVLDVHLYLLCLTLTSVVNLHSVQHMRSSSDTVPHLHYHTLDAKRCCRPCQSDWYWRWCWSTATLNITEYEAGDELHVIDTTQKHNKVEPEDQLNIFAPRTSALPLSAAIISGVRPDWSAASTGAS